MSKVYANAEAFRNALEDRLRAVAQERGVQIQGLRLKVAIERLLARLFVEKDSPWLLKGGYAMELRFRPKARTTSDIDLVSRTDRANATLPARLAAAHETLRAAAVTDPGDFFEFQIQQARSELQGPPDGGGSFPVIARMAGRDFARFHIDVGFGDAVMGVPELLVGEDLLGFAGVAAARVSAVPRAQQFAEKIHAYTSPWTDRVNTRSRDLVDMVLLIERGELDPIEVHGAIVETFRRRARQVVPPRLSAPPESWKTEFALMATVTGLSTRELNVAFEKLEWFWGELGSFDGP